VWAIACAVLFVAGIGLTIAGALVLATG